MDSWLNLALPGSFSTAPFNTLTAAHAVPAHTGVGMHAQWQSRVCMPNASFMFSLVLPPGHLPFCALVAGWVSPIKCFAIGCALLPPETRAPTPVPRPNADLDVKGAVVFLMSACRCSPKAYGGPPGSVSWPEVLMALTLASAVEALSIRRRR